VGSEASRGEAELSSGKYLVANKENT